MLLFQIYYKRHVRSHVLKLKFSTSAMFVHMY